MNQTLCRDIVCDKMGAWKHNGSPLKRFDVDKSTRSLTLSAPGYFCLIMPRGDTKWPPFINPDRKMLWTWNLTQSYLVMLQKSWWEKKFKVAAIAMMTSLIMSIFRTVMRKTTKICFFLKLTLLQLEKRFSRSFLSFWKSR